jgi:hypothetical protein
MIVLNLAPILSILKYVHAFFMFTVTIYIPNIILIKIYFFYINSHYCLTFIE